MPPTFGQFEALAHALCAVLRTPAAGWRQPFSIDVYPSMIPDHFITYVAPEEGWAPSPTGPGGFDIESGGLHIAFDDRGCFWSVSVRGYVTTADGKRERAARASEWMPIT